MRNEVQIIGCGNVGSQVAKELLDLNYFNVINIVDTNKRKLVGHIMDLKRVKKLRELDTQIKYSTKPKNFQLNIITVGEKRDFEKHGNNVNKETYRKNMPIVLDIMDNFKNNYSGTFIIVTHPAKIIAKDLDITYPNFFIIHAGDMVDDTGIDGRKIQELKGHTSFGIATEIGMIVKKRNVDRRKK